MLPYYNFKNQFPLILIYQFSHFKLATKLDSVLFVLGISIFTTTTELSLNCRIDESVSLIAPAVTHTYYMYLCKISLWDSHNIPNPSQFFFYSVIFVFQYFKTSFNKMLTLEIKRDKYQFFKKLDMLL